MPDKKEIPWRACVVTVTRYGDSISEVYAVPRGIAKALENMERYVEHEIARVRAYQDALLPVVAWMLEDENGDFIINRQIKIREHDEVDQCMSEGTQPWRDVIRRLINQASLGGETP